jgi:hypothetical protein
MHANTIPGWKDNSWHYESGTHWADRGGALVPGEDPVAVTWDSNPAVDAETWNVEVFARWNTDNSPRWTRYTRGTAGWMAWSPRGGPAADGLAIPQSSSQILEPRIIAKGHDNHMWELRD